MRGRGGKGSKADDAAAAAAAARIAAGPRETPETSLLHVYGSGPLAPVQLGSGGRIAATLAARNRAQSTESQDWRQARDHTLINGGDLSPSLKREPTAASEAEGQMAARSPTPTSADRAALAAAQELELEFPDAQPPPPEEDEEEETEEEAEAEAGAEAEGAAVAEEQDAAASEDPAEAEAAVAAEFPDEQPPPPDEAEFPDEQPPPPEDDEEEEAEEEQAQEPEAVAEAEAEAAEAEAAAEPVPEAEAKDEAQAEPEAAQETPDELQPVDTPSPIEAAAAAASPTASASETPPSDVPVIEPAPAAAPAPRRVQLSNLMHTEREDADATANGGAAAESKEEPDEVEEEEVILLNGRSGRPARSTRRPEGSAAADAAVADLNGSPRAAQSAELYSSPPPPKTFAQSVATRFLSIAERPIGTSFTPPKEELSVSPSPASAGFTASPTPRPALTAFTVFMEGYLKRKAMVGGARSANAAGVPTPIHVVRGQAGQRLYLVWHSKGLSGYPSQDAYLKDQKPDIHFVNAWNKRKPAATEEEDEEEREEKELMMVPYSTQSSSNLKQAQKDLTLLRLLLCFPSVLKASSDADPSDPAAHASAAALAAQSFTVMILKAPNAETRNVWLAASARIHQEHARTRHLHTKLLPLLMRVLDDPQAFLQAHAPPKPPMRLTAARDDDDDEQPNPFSPTSQSSSSSSSATAAEQQLLSGFHSPASPFGAGGAGAASSPKRLSVIASVEREEDEDEDGEALAKRTPVAPVTEENDAVADAFQTPAKSAAAPSPTAANGDVSRASPALEDREGTTDGADGTRPAHSHSISQDSPSLSSTEHSEVGLPGLQGMGLTKSMVQALQSGNDAALSAPSPADEPVVADAASPVLPATPVAFWALNGETPLFPDLPLQDVSAFAMPSSGFGPVASTANSPAFGSSSPNGSGDASKPAHARSLSSPRFSTFREGGGAAGGSLLSLAADSAASPKSAAVQSPAVSLELMGPRRLMVEELLALIVLHFPGSQCLTALEAALMTDNLTLPASPGPSTRALTLACFSSEQWSRPHMAFAFLLFRGAYMDCPTLLARLRSFWRWAATTVAAAHDPAVEIDEPRYLPEGAWIDKHAAHHIQANVLWMLLSWVTHFRRDYLSIQDDLDTWLRSEVYPFVAAWHTAGQPTKEGEFVEEPLTCAENVRIGAGALSSSQFARDAARTLLPARCVNLTLLAAQISSIIAHTGGSNQSVLASFIKTPLPTMSPPLTAVSPMAHRRAGSISLTSMGSSRALLTTDGSAATSAAASSSPRSSGRTVASPLMRRESFRTRSRSSLDLSSSMPPLQLQDSGSNLLAGVGGSSPHSGTGESFPDLHSQAHRLPAALARKQSLTTFLKKFVAPTGETLLKGVLAFTPRQLAAELTNLDVEQMQCIYTRELTHKAWTGSKSSLGALGVPQSWGVTGSIAHLTSAHVLQVIESFNRRSFWVASEILRANENSSVHAGNKECITPDHDASWPARVKLLEYFIAVLEELRVLCNFSALFAVLNGLQLQPLFRLKQLWSAVNPKSLETLHSIRDGICSPSHNHAQYRSYLRKLQSKRAAFIPHFGLLLKDLFLLEEMASFAAVPVALASSAASMSSAASSSSSAPPVVSRLSSQMKFAAAPHLQWSKWSRQYVEIHNSVLLCQTNVARYEAAQIVKESSEVQMEMEDAAAAAAEGGRSPSAGSPRQLNRQGSTVGGSSSVVRPALPPSDPSLRMTLHVCFSRVLNDAALSKYSYRCQPKRTT